MSLYQKYRPSAFDQIFGNENMLAILQADLTKEDPPHAILLYGPVGCGKTTLGRLIAATVGCRDRDLAEVDSADFRGIDTIREIRQKAQFKPIFGPCRVWLLDECFAAGTIVTTMLGTRLIEHIVPGDHVYSLAGLAKVKHVFKNKIPIERVMKVRLSSGIDIYCTVDHEFLTEDGWVRAKNLIPTEFLISGPSEAYENDSLLQNMQGANTQQTVLQSKLSSQRQNETPRNSGCNVQSASQEEDFRKTQGILEHSQRDADSPNAFTQDEISQSINESGNLEKNNSNQTPTWNTLDRKTGREWPIDGTTDQIGQRIRVANGNSNFLRSEAIGISNVLQSGHREPNLEISSRGRWEIASIEKEQIQRCKEDVRSCQIRVESVEIYQRGHNDQSFQRIVSDREKEQGWITFYDLEMEKNPSYFVHNVAVHNCHKLTNDAQNALLKALEEAPAHVYYILATTDPQKLIETVKSRCSQYQVQPLSDKTMFKLIRGISKAEGIMPSPEVIDQIVRDSQGHPRTALQILDQVLTAPPETQLAVARHQAEIQSQTIALCRALLSLKGWKLVSNVLSGLKDEDPEGVRRAIMGYCTTVMLKESGPSQMTAAKVMEQMIETPIFYTGFAGLVYACFSAVHMTRDDPPF